MDDSRSSLSPEVPLTAGVFARWLDRRVLAGARLVVGLSGGRDSVALLHLAASSPRRAEFQLAALHVNHGLSPHADEWVEHCAALAASLSVPLTVVPVRVPHNAPEGPEAAARAARYEAFSRLDADFLLLGHHREDQAETVLLNLLRGAGVGGLAGMPRERALVGSAGSGLRISRPLLDCPRSAIDDYVATFGLRHVEDESNRDVRFTRNFVRHAVMPILAARFPDVTQRLSETADRCAASASLLDALAELDGQSASTGNRLVVSRLRAFSDERLSNLLIWQLARRGVAVPSAARLREALRQIREAGPQCHAEVVFGPLAVRIWRDQLFFVRPGVAPDGFVWRGEPEVAWGSGRLQFSPVVGSGIRASLFDGANVELRTRRGGERFTPDAKRPRRPLKDWFQTGDLPPWDRSGVPLLWREEQLLWVGGLGCAPGAQANAGEAGWLIDWIRD